ncbi:MAG TPA: L-seryl-tRNA(Sec) selenium transferase, partial [Actinomycetota bacterium]|nr:L-seryl-tRNA(Sec) selenium transferase [Actinomycetota bacterium]
MPSEDVRKRLRALPAVDRVLDELRETPHRVALEAARRALEGARKDILRGAETPTLDAVIAQAKALLTERERAMLRSLLNATGVLVHTNLGRSPLGSEQLTAVAAIAGGYSNLEYDLDRGRRGSRYDHAQRLFTELTGAEACLVVNNNAAALLLVLASLCAGKEVVISRGELIEIGGEFRIPEVMEASGARLVEVGTTNRTHLVDYERAISPDTAAILKVHTSNYEIVGFTASVPARDLAKLASGRGLPLIYDLGSGLIGAPASVPQYSPEPPVDLAVSEGADVVTFSGDKLFGGPQAGIVVGRQHLVARLGKHPILRALRVDKMTLAALEATAAAYLEGTEEKLPLWQMALAPVEDIERRARSLVSALGASALATNLKAEAVPSQA